VGDALVAVDAVVEEYAREYSNQTQIYIKAAKNQDESAVKKAEKLERDLIVRIRALQSLHRKKNVLTL